MIDAMADSDSLEPRCRELLDFYFGEASRPDCDLETFRTRTKFWFMRNAATDTEIRTRFAPLVDRAVAGELDAWKETALGRLALVVLLDQFPRNLNRDSARAFDHDARALALTLEGVEHGDHAALTPGEKLVFYLPIMHSEEKALQARASQLYTELAGESAVLGPELDMAKKFALRHREIIDRFGRFPHRNKVLGRESTAEEIAFLQEPNSSF